ncbi:hypothetical protein GW17_00059546 [Ensete ventricosum]|nr:hypothetical protein GW17_00059546 [Ensete ventricosum]
MHRVDAIGNSPRVRWELAEGIRSLPGWRKGVRQKKIETRRRLSRVAEKLIGIWTMRWDLAESSLGDSPKGSGSSLGARWEIIGRRLDDLAQECRRLPDWWKLGLSLSLWSLSVVIVES